MIINKKHTVGLMVDHAESGVWYTFCRECSRQSGSMISCVEIRERFPHKVSDYAYKVIADNARRGRSIDSNTMALSKNARDTSREAVARNLGRAGTKKRRVFDLIKEHDGLTDDEIEVLTGYTHQSASSSRNRLMNDGFVYATQERRRTRQGEKAIVWKAVP